MPETGEANIKIYVPKKEDAPGNQQRHLPSAVVGELHEEVACLFADVPVEHGDLEEIGHCGLVVEGEVDSHCALARTRSLRLEECRQNEL